ncbi:hypothetical protein ElyMa_005941000 [Elysia marginata]|uniref:Uncharacterized protein n=1 Tax=Elysia marginata TaxID=1093978 RepID=A0AAV4GAS1_9GAST|nr:hypothetical protein ElyMa_005941000 [Elysia marginata]
MTTQANQLEHRIPLVFNFNPRFEIENAQYVAYGNINFTDRGHDPDSEGHVPDSDQSGHDPDSKGHDPDSYQSGHDLDSEGHAPDLDQSGHDSVSDQ